MMWRHPLVIGAIVLIIVLAIWMISGMVGSGGFERKFTLTGIYAVIRPDGMDAACFVDADTKQGTMSCLPCSVLNDCKKR